MIILKSENYNHPDNESRLYCQHRIFTIRGQMPCHRYLEPNA